MALGPIFRYELIVTARRGRYYAARFAYGLFLGCLLARVYSQVLRWNQFYRYNHYTIGSAWYPRRVPTVGSYSDAIIEMMARISAAMVEAFAVSRWVTALVVVPALTAGVIADAHRRKTLRDLLASGLSGPSIVVGKLAARLVHVAVFALLGLPVLVIAGLLGGLDPWAVFYAYAGTASIALGVGGVSILVSTLARWPRDAVILAYALEAAWLSLPPVLSPLLPQLTWPFYLLKPVNDVLLMSSPAMIWSGFSRPVYAYNPSYYQHTYYLTMMACQVACGVICTALAAALLRPVRSGDGEVPGLKLTARLRKRLVRPPARRAGWRRPSWVSTPVKAPCGDDPMGWKERYATPRGGLAWSTSLPAVLFLGTLLGCVLFESVRPSIRGALTLGRLPATDLETRELHTATRWIGTTLFVFWLLAVSSAAAVSVVSEREDDTWTSLTTTLVTGPELARAKAFGALWGARRVAVALLAVIAVGALGGGLHPLGALGALLGLAAYGTFAAALGVFVSLRAANSTRALVVTILLLTLVNATPLLLRAETDSVTWMAMMPFMEWLAFASHGEIVAIQFGFRPSGLQPGYIYMPFAVHMFAVSLGLYSLAALGLTRATGRAYDRVAGRARRGRGRRVRPSDRPSRSPFPKPPSGSFCRDRTDTTDPGVSRPPSSRAGR